MPTDPTEWVADAIFYQVFPDRFARSERVQKPGRMEDWDAPPTVFGFKGGDLHGVADRLDYLDDLGINAIYLNPVFASAANHRYHTFDYHHVDPLLGGDAALRNLLDSAHERGMRVILDGVFNHSGRGFWPFHHVLEAGRHSPYVDWFHLDHDRLDQGRRLDAYPDSGDEPAAVGSLLAFGYRGWWDLPALPKLNVGNPEVLAFLLGIAEHWLQVGADGWRFDVPEELPQGFWQEVHHRVRSIRPDAYLVGEIWHPAPEWTGETGPFDAVMNYPMAWAIIGFAAGRRLDAGVAAEQDQMRANLRPIDAPEFAKRLDVAAATYSMRTQRRQLNLLASHDTPRLRTVCGDDRTSGLLAFLLQMTLPGAPCVYYGEEIGMPGHHDPGCRGGFPWDEGQWDVSTRDFVRSAIGLRRAHPALRSTDLAVLAAEGHAILIRRGTGTEALWVAVNAGDEVASVALAPQDGTDGPGILLQVGSDPRVVETGLAGVLELAPRSGSVLRPRGTARSDG